MTQIYIKQNTHKHQTQNFRRFSPFGITPVKKTHKARTRWYRGPFRRFINTSGGTGFSHLSTERVIPLLRAASIFSMRSIFAVSAAAPLPCCYCAACMESRPMEGRGRGGTLLTEDCSLVGECSLRLSGSATQLSLSSVRA